jgi:O-antigen ligase
VSVAVLVQRPAAATTHAAGVVATHLPVIAFAGVCSFLITVPSINAVTRLSYGYDFARIAQWLLALLCALALLAQPNHARRAAKPAVIRTWLIGALSLLITLGATSIVLAAEPQWAMREAAIWMGMVSVALLVARSDYRRQRDLAWAVAGAMALYGIGMLLFVVVGLVVGHSPTPHWLSFEYGNYRHFNHVQTIALPLLAGIAASAIEQRLRFLALVGLAAQTALLLFLFGRGTLIALGLATALVAVLFRRAAVRYLRSLLAGIATGACLWALVFVVLPWLLSVSIDSSGARVFDGSDTARLTHWRIAFHDASEAPWFGKGPMHYSHAASHLIRGDAAHPHNLYLQIACEWGTPFLVITLLIGGFGLARFTRAVKKHAVSSVTVSRSTDTALGVGLAAVLFAAAADAFVSGNAVAPVSQTWIAVAVGWAVAWSTHCMFPSDYHIRYGVDSKSSTVKPRLLIWIAASLVTMQIWLGINAAPQAFHLPEHLKAAKQRVPSGLSQPRFWSHGWF